MTIFNSKKGFISSYQETYSLDKLYQEKEIHHFLKFQLVITGITKLLLTSPYHFYIQNISKVFFYYFYSLLIPLDFLCRQLCYLQIRVILFLVSNSYFISFTCFIVFLQNLQYNTEQTQGGPKMAEEQMGKPLSPPHIHRKNI